MVSCHLTTTILFGYKGIIKDGGKNTIGYYEKILNYLNNFLEYLHILRYSIKYMIKKNRQCTIRVCVCVLHDGKSP